MFAVSALLDFLRRAITPRRQRAATAALLSELWLSQRVAAYQYAQRPMQRHRPFSAPAALSDACAVVVA